MIGFIKGLLDSVLDDRIYVDNQGVGFEIFIPGSVHTQLPPVGEPLKIYTYMHVREEILQLYGFLTRGDLEMFRLLITVNGVGPKGALGILTVMDTDELRLAILRDDAKAIAKAPGIGGKTANKVILELKDKCHLEDVLPSEEYGEDADVRTDSIKIVREEAIEALEALGYSASEAASAVRRIKVHPDMTVEELLKDCLKNI